MTTSDRFAFMPDPQAGRSAEQGQADRFDFFLDTATRWAHTVGRRLRATGQWVESESMVNRPLSTLGIAFGLGVFTGWLVKRH